MPHRRTPRRQSSDETGTRGTGPEVKQKNTGGLGPTLGLNTEHQKKNRFRGMPHRRAPRRQSSDETGTREQEPEV